MRNSNPMEHKDPEEVTTIHEYKPITEWNTRSVRGSLRARVVERKGKKYLDLREWHQGESFEGWTRRGLRFSAAELRVLEDIIEDAKKRLIPENSGSGKDANSWHKSSNVTGAGHQELPST